MKKMILMIVCIIVISELAGCSSKTECTNTCECEKCWAELEEIEHMYE